MRNRIGRLAILLLCVVLSACASKSRQSGAGAAAPPSPSPAPQRQAIPQKPAKPPAQAAAPRIEAKPAGRSTEPVIENSMMHYPEPADDPWAEQADEPFQPLISQEAAAPELAVQGPPESVMVDYGRKDEFGDSSSEDTAAFGHDGLAAENDWGAAPAQPEISAEESFQTASPAADHEEDGVLPPENILPPTVFEEYEEEGILAQEAIMPPTLFEDYAETDFMPEETISNPVLMTEHEYDGVVPEELITGHQIFHNDTSIAAHEDTISAPRHFAQDSEESLPELQASLPEPQPQTAYVSPFDAAPPFEEVIDAVVEDRSYAAVVEAQTAQFSEPPAREESAILVAQAAPVANPDPMEEPKVAQPQAIQPSQTARTNVPTQVAALAPSAITKPSPAINLPAPTAPNTEEHLMTVVLSADALFDFGKHKLRAAGKKSLDEFAAGLTDVQWGEIKIVGHTDRLGSAKFNKRLSEKRAQAVKTYLMSKKLSGKKIKVAGKGKAQPITAQCEGTKSSPALIECLQPDRRVEIFVDEKREVKKVVKVSKPKKTGKVSQKAR